MQTLAFGLKKHPGKALARILLCPILPIYDKIQELQ